MINKDSRLESYWHRCSFKSCGPSLILSRIFGLGDEHLAARVGLRRGALGKRLCTFETDVKIFKGVVCRDVDFES